MNIEIHHVEIVDTPMGEQFVLSMRRDGSDRDVIHQFPVDIIETRMAEYGFTVNEFDKVLEAIIYEPYAGNVDPDDPDSLYNADTIPQAKAALLARVAAAKGDGQLTGITGQAAYTAAGPDMTVLDHSATDDPLQFLKDRAQFSSEHAKVKRAFIQKLRAEDAPRRAARKERRQRMRDRVRTPRPTPTELAALLAAQAQPEPQQPPVVNGGKK